MAKEKIYLKINPYDEQEDFVLIKENGEKLIGHDAGDYITQHHETIEEVIIIPQGSVSNALYDESLLSPQITAARKLAPDEFDIKSAKYVNKGTATLLEWVHNKDSSLGAGSAAKVFKYASRGLDIVDVIDKHAKGKGPGEISATDVLRIVRDTAGKWFATSVVRSAVLVLIPGACAFPVSVMVAAGVAASWDDIVKISSITFDAALEVSRYLDQGDKSLDRMFAERFAVSFPLRSDEPSSTKKISDDLQLDKSLYDFTAQPPPPIKQDNRLKWGATISAGGLAGGASFTFSSGAATTATAVATVTTTGEVSAGIVLATSSALMGPLVIASVAAIGTYIIYDWTSERLKRKHEKYHENLNKIREQTAKDPNLISAASATTSDVLSEKDKIRLQSIWDQWAQAEIDVKDRDSFVRERAWFFERKQGRKARRHYQELVSKYQQQFYAEQSWSLSSGYAKLMAASDKSKTEFEKATILLDDKLTKFIVFLREKARSHCPTPGKGQCSIVKLQKFMEGIIAYPNKTVLPKRGSYTTEKEWLQEYLAVFHNKITLFCNFIKQSASSHKIQPHKKEWTLVRLKRDFFDVLINQQITTVGLSTMSTEDDFIQWGVNSIKIIDRNIDSAIAYILKATKQTTANIDLGRKEGYLRHFMEFFRVVSNYSDTRHPEIDMNNLIMSKPIEKISIQPTSKSPFCTIL